MTNEKAPERIYMHPTSAEANVNPWPFESGEYVEYARVDRKYSCSCGGALTAEEYITHYFEMGHDRGIGAKGRASAAPVVDNWSKESPKVNGVYWWRADAKDLEPDIHAVVAGQFYQIGSSESVVVENFGGEWLGPITPTTAAPVEQSDPSQTHDWVGKGDNCELPGCRLGVLEHLKLPEIDFSK